MATNSGKGKKITPENVIIITRKRTIAYTPGMNWTVFSLGIGSYQDKLKQEQKENMRYRILSNKIADVFNFKKTTI